MRPRCQIRSPIRCAPTVQVRKISRRPCLFDGRQDLLQQQPHFLRRADCEPAAQRILHVVSITLPDPEDDPRDLRKVRQKAVHQLTKPGARSRRVTAQPRIDGGGSRQVVRGDEYLEPVRLRDGEQLAELLAQYRIALAQLRFEPRMVGQVREIIERDGVVAESGHLARQCREVLADPGPLLGALLAARCEMSERNLRPVDPPLVESAEEWSDGVDQGKLHVSHDSRKRMNYQAGSAAPAAIFSRCSLNT